MTQKLIPIVDITDRADGRIPVWRDADNAHVYEEAGAFSPDLHLPWHVYIPVTISTPDATTGTWVLSSSSAQIVQPFYTPGSTANSGQATEYGNSSNAQNDAAAWDVVLAAGTWDAHFWVRANSAGPIITLNQDGASQGTVDTYNAANTASKVSITGWTVATTGKKRMQLLLATKNASSSAYALRMAGIEFRRTA